MSKEKFKAFAKTHPELISRVMNNEVTWQKLYELYDIYGSDEEVWSKYIIASTSNPQTSQVGFREVINNIKNLDMDSVQKGIENIQKTVGLIQEIGVGGATNAATAATSSLRNYEPRTTYRRLDD